ncbi:spondin-1-like isoform X1 [Cydia amplana]|uniref:spondin-1-like isoform X1 n=1 Tax=Cydia amplana TaxID=1869771 RepID=UPI002FE535FE
MSQTRLAHFLLLLILFLKPAISFRCDRRPYGSTSLASPSDGRFQLNIIGTDDTYLPEEVYTIQITRTDDESEFTAFMLSAEGDLKQDPRNPRRMLAQNPGELRPQSQASGKYSDRCLYSVEQASYNTKSSVEVYWEAPPAGSGCVTIRAMVAESQEVWFEDGAPLTRKLCEDMRQPDDVSPNLNYECNICDEAKYQVTFTGIWSRNIHPRLYPESDWLPRYSDLIGASHATDFVLWAPGELASDGLRQLAEHANSSKLEAEIREKIGDGVRTVIKAKGHGYKKMDNPSHAFFRADKVNHLITTAVAMYPSPDWFLGVTRFELCQEGNTWLQEKELNLYPWDAGTDSGVSYESPNIETYPQDAIGRVQMSSYDKNSPFYGIDVKDVHPFGRIRIQLIRTYKRDCEESTEEKEEEEEKPKEPESGEEKTDSESQEPDEPSRYQNPDIASDEHGRSSEIPLDQDPESTEECPMTQWLEWSPCEGLCEDGTLTGYKWRERYHLVDGLPIEMYDPNEKHPSKKEVPTYCKTHFEDFERMECEEPCTEEGERTEVTAERRRNMIIPGHPWGSRKRELFNKKNIRSLL